MGIVHALTENLIEECAERGRLISYKLAYYTMKAETADGWIRAMMKGMDSKEQMMAFANVSERFLEISMKRHSLEDGEEEGATWVLEQIAEVRAMELKNPQMDQDTERFERERMLRDREKYSAVQTFLGETNYSSERIAELVGVPVPVVECFRLMLGTK